MLLRFPTLEYIEPNKTAEVKLLSEFTEPNWKEANCQGVDPEIFFPVSEDKGLSRAKYFCDDCSIQIECKNWATDTRQFGIWGGTTTDERNPKLVG